MDQATLKRRTILTSMFFLTIDRHRQPRPAAQWTRRTRVAKPGGDHRIQKADGCRAIGDRLGEDDAALIVAGACLDQP